MPKAHRLAGLFFLGSRGVKLRCSEIQENGGVGKDGARLVTVDVKGIFIYCLGAKTAGIGIAEAVSARATAKIGAG